MLDILIAIFLIFGLSFVFWSLIGAMRLFFDKFIFHKKKLNGVEKINGQDEVAVCMSAHNEELVIVDAISALKKIVSHKHIYIVNDASTDQTSELAKQEGCNVYDLFKNGGKASALDNLLNSFNLYDRYKYVIFVDADTRLREDYITNALPIFKDKKIAAVAGFARSQWKNNIYVAYRSRIWFLVQVFFRFGMTWKFTNLNMIVPGFASMYRTDVLRQIDIARPGMVIEDYNMNFELQKKKLGRMAHYSNVTGFTQDPSDFKSYVKQVQRWNLGFWQTIKVNGVWPSIFWLNLSIYLLELFVASLTIIILPILLLSISAIFIINLFNPLSLELINAANFIGQRFLILLAVDLSLSLIVAIAQKRIAILLYSPTMLFFRWLDAYYFLTTIFQAIREKSNGQWKSPTRW